MDGVLHCLAGAGDHTWVRAMTTASAVTGSCRWKRSAVAVEQHDADHGAEQAELVFGPAVQRPGEVEVPAVAWLQDKAELPRRSAPGGDPSREPAVGQQELHPALQ